MTQIRNQQNNQISERSHHPIGTVDKPGPAECGAMAPEGFWVRLRNKSLVNCSRPGGVSFSAMTGSCNQKKVGGEEPYNRRSIMLAIGVQFKKMGRIAVGLPKSTSSTVFERRSALQNGSPPAPRNPRPPDAADVLTLPFPDVRLCLRPLFTGP